MNHLQNNSNKGFTLIELLVVIAIIAILSIVVILTINPAELLRQARDSNRVSDLSILKTAVSLYLTDVLNPKLASSTYLYTACYLSTVSGAGTTTLTCGFNFKSSFTQNASTTLPNLRKLDATGWFPVDFTRISAGTPFGQLPIDPLNNVNYYYAYAASTTVFEVDTFLENAKYSSYMANDGGDNPSAYEAGTNLNL